MVFKGFRNELWLRNKNVSRFKLGDSVVIIFKFRNVFPKFFGLSPKSRYCPQTLTQRSLSVLRTILASFR
jgi:hypothetical protein